MKILIKYKTCESEMAKSAKTRTFYKRWWFWVIVAVVVIVAIGR